MQGSSHQLIPLFDGDKFDFWSVKMATILRSRKLWSVVEDGIPEQVVPQNETAEASRKRIRREEEANLNDVTALQLLQTAVSDSIFSRIASCTTSKEAWDTLKLEYEGTSQVRLVKLQSLRREYENLRMAEGESIKTFTDKLIDLENQLTYHGEKKTNYQLVQKILISLPARFDSVVSVMEQTRDLSLMTMTELIGILKAHEARVDAREVDMSEGAFNIQARRKSLIDKQGSTRNRSEEKNEKRWCNYCKKNNHLEERCFKKMKDLGLKRAQSSNKTCFNCGKVGHFSKDCRSKKKERAHVSQEE